MKEEDYNYIVVESFIPDDLSGKHGKVHIRPVEDQGVFKKEYFVQCSKVLSEDYPVGTKFRIRAKLTNMQGTLFISSHYTWAYEVLD